MFQKRTILQATLSVHNMNIVYIFLILLGTLVFPVVATSQQSQSVNYYPVIKSFDLKKLWHADSIQIEGDGENMPFPEPLGYIGDNYQRFYIHYSSVVKSSAYTYKVTGKTMVKGNICRFSGTIRVVKATLYEESNDPRYKQGSLTCAITFYEDSTQPSTGIIKGRLTTDFCLNSKGNISYNALMAVADGYYNNQCEATWTSYKTGKSKKCNWGDYRIPDCKDLDVGAGVFIANEKYIRSGWGEFEEDREWWK
jgi:hypothetical protein